MAIDAPALDSACRTGFGPLALARDGAAWIATFEGARATVSVDGPTVRVGSRVSIEWPTEHASPDEVDTRVALAFRELALSRPELCTIHADDGRESISVTMWIDAGSASMLGLAQCVRLTIALSAVAATTVTQIRNGLAAEARAMAAAHAVADDVQRARRMLGLADDADADAARPGAPPSMSAPPTGPPPGPPTATVGAFAPTHTTPRQGARTWPSPDVSHPEGPTLPAGLHVQVTEVRGAWAHVRCSNDWTAWLDGRLLDDQVHGSP